MSLKHLVLGLLNYAPATGYDLKKVFNDSAQHFWHTEQSQIYRALHKLHEDGYVEIELVQQDDKPNKKIYHVSAEGKSELLRWVSTPQSLPTVHESWIGQVCFAGEVKNEEIAIVIEARIKNLQKAIHLFETILPSNVAHYSTLYSSQTDQLFWNMTIDYGLKKLQFDLDWAEKALEQIHSIAESQKDPQ